MPHRYGRPYDIYDDTQYAPHPSDQLTVHHYPPPTRERRRRNRAPEYQQHADPFQSMNDAMALMERDFAQAFESPFGSSMLGSMNGIMSSFDRMFAEFASASASGNGSYYYESSTTTVGPDGRMRQETVRTEPGADGNPHTSHFVREGGRVHDQSYDRYAIQPSHSNPIDDEVIVEEVDGDDDCLRPPRHRDRTQDDEHRNRSNHRDDRHYTPVNWVRDRLNRWRSRH